jgi:hypothetical protein
MAESIQKRVDGLEERVAVMDKDIREAFDASNVFVQQAVNGAEGRLNGRIDRLELTVVEFNERMATRIEETLTARLVESEQRVTQQMTVLLTQMEKRLSRK